jgi:outer membrane protein OmpA-like peptidoglycan-associated protein
VVVPQLAGQDETDINVTHHADDQSETSIAVNPVNPDNIVIAVNDADGNDGLFGSATSSDWVYVTVNGGVNWVRMQIPVPAAAPADANGAPDGTRSHGDPAIVFSRDGSRLVFTHMVDKDPAGHDADNANHRHVMVTAVSLPDINGNLGTAWNQADTGVVGYDVAHQAVGFQVDEDGGLNPNDTFPDDSDKEYIAVGPDVDDPSQDRFVVTWHRGNVIYASTSLDGINWTTAQKIGGLTGGDGENAPFGNSIDAIPSFGSNGEIYVVWEEFGTPGVSRILFDASFDGGVTWGAGNDAKVMFGVDDSTLDSGDEAILDDVIAALNANPDLIITVAGYASTSGTEENNQDLSDDRAEAVRHYLVDLNGIDASRVTVLGFGETQLAVSTADGVENADNRRF